MKLVQVVFLSFFLFCGFNAQAVSSVPEIFAISNGGICSLDPQNDTDFWLAEILEEDDRSEEFFSSDITDLNFFGRLSAQKADFVLIGQHQIVTTILISDIHSRGPPIFIILS